MVVFGHKKHRGLLFLSKKTQYEKLKERKSIIEKKLAALEAKEKAKARKDDTRLKVLIGAAFLADAKINPKTDKGIRIVLQRAITSERDRAFLKRMGWFETETEEEVSDGPPGQ